MVVNERLKFGGGVVYSGGQKTDDVKEIGDKYDTSRLRKHLR